MFKINKTIENVKFLGFVRSKVEQDKLITDFKISSHHVSFNIKNDDPFIVCQYLNENQIATWLDIVEVKNSNISNA